LPLRWNTLEICRQKIRKFKGREMKEEARYDVYTGSLIHCKQRKRCGKVTLTLRP